jgi:preprotein translocase subunit SecE
LAKEDNGDIIGNMDKPKTAKVPNIAPVQFLQEVIGELKKVTWPSREETMKLTAVVIALSVIVGIFIGGLDALLIQIQKIVFK